MNKQLEWSSLMGSCTRERAMEIIQREKKGGRFPTVSELEEDSNSPYHNTDNNLRRFWLQGGNSFYSRVGRSRLVENPPKDWQADVIIVWEV